MAHKIALIKLEDTYSYDSYGDSIYNVIVNSMTEWEEVSHEDFVMLKAAEGRFNYRVIELITDLHTFIPKTISDYKEMLRKEEQAREAEKKKREATNLAKKMKKDLKDKESKIELFKKLQAELGDTVK